jgi:hypothetical protein
MSTVGYGDFSASTQFGRLCVICLFVVGVYAFGAGTSKLVALNSAFNAGKDRLINRDRDPVVVVCGSFDVHTFNAFLGELYHKERFSVNVFASRRLCCVLLEDDKLLPRMRRIVKETPFYRKRVKILSGTPFYADDLRRAGTAEAEACFILSCAGSQSSGADDDVGNIFRSMSIKRFAPDLPVIMLLQSFLSAGRVISCRPLPEHVVYRDRLKMKYVFLPLLCYCLISDPCVCFVAFLFCFGCLIAYTHTTYVFID